MSKTLRLDTSETAARFKNLLEVNGCIKQGVRLDLSKSQLHQKKSAISGSVVLPPPPGTQCSLLVQCSADRM